MQLTLTVPSPCHTDELIHTMRQLYPAHRVFCFEGELGAGKTTLIKELCADLGVNEEMSSPSFGLVNEYKSDQEGMVYHLDLYRLRNPEELLDIGWEDYLNTNALMFIEWPEKGRAYMPDNAVRVHIETIPHTEERLLTISYTS